MISSLWQDVRYAARGFYNNRAFTVAAILAIALGIGVNTGIFSILNGLALRDLPAPNAGKLVSIHQRFENPPQRSVHGSRSMFSTSEYRAYRDRTQTLTGIMSYSTGVRATLGGANPELLQGGLVSCNYFAVLELPPALGPGFNPADCENPDTSRAVILTHDLWTSQFASDPGIIGREILLNRQPFRVAGIAPEGFAGTELFKLQFFAPLASQKALIPDRDFYNAEHLSWLTLVGRRKDGADLAQVRADLGVIASQIDQQESPRKTTLLIERATSMPAPEMRSGFLVVGSVIMAAFGMVLLIACANVANLLLARAASRSKEVAVRLSLGSSRGRLIQQLLTESVMLSVFGGILGSALAVWSFRAVFIFVLSSLPGEVPAISIDTSPDLGVLAFAFGLTLVTGVVFGLVPALMASNPDLYLSLKQDSSGSSYRSGGWLRGGLVGVQIAICTVLMVAAGLVLRGLYAAQTADPGFNYENVAVVSYDLRGGGYDEARATAFQQQLRERVSSLPGVEAAEQVRITPLTPGRSEFMVGLPGRPERFRIGINFVTPGYFDVVDIPIVLGRTFAANELQNTSRAIIVTESTARRYWPGQNPIGQNFSMQIEPNQEVILEVVGIAKDVHLYDFTEIENSYMYLPAVPRQQADLRLLVRSRSVDFAQVAGGIRAAAHEIDPGLVVRVSPLEDNLELWRTLSRLVTALAGALGTLALLLASIGVYGVVSYAVSRRLREVGIRMVLGASPRAVLRMILKQALRPAIIGLAIGLAGAAAVSQILQSVLFGISPHDSIAFAGTALFLLGVTALASWLPARRATRVDPMTTLRYE